MRIIPLGHGKNGGSSICNITMGEVSVIRALRRRGQATIKELSDDVYGDTNRDSYNTIQMLLARLKKKGYVEHDGEKRPQPRVWSIAKSENVLQVLSTYATKIMQTLFNTRNGSQVKYEVRKASK